MSDLPTPSDQDTVPQIILRIPGPWESPEQLRLALEKAKGGYAMPTPQPGGEAFLVHQHTGLRFGLAAVDRDDELVELFADTRRMKPDELKALKKHKVKMILTGPGGSLESARAFLAAGAALIKAGGLGVMVDNSGSCHGPRDWLSLAGDREMGGMYWAFVSVTATENEVFSAGMHCLGFRDAEMFNPIDPRSSGMMMHEFLGYTYQSGANIVDGDPIGGPDGPEFILRQVPCTRFPKDMPWHNPYGVWRLEKFSQGDNQ